jgi:uroporphyrinogen-III synthase
LPPHPDALNDHPLQGKRIVITAPHDNSTDWLAMQLTSRGADVVHVPLIAIQGVSFVLPPATLFDWLFFTSKNGARFFFERLAEIENPATQAPLRALPIATVGTVTADALKPYDIQAAFISPRHDAESAAHMFASHTAPLAPRVLWPCGNLANQALPEILATHAISVTPLIVYQTQLKNSLTPAEQNTLSVAADLLVFTSASGVQAYRALLSGRKNPSQPTPVACLGPQTAQAWMGPVAVQPRHHTLKDLNLAILAFFQAATPSEATDEKS